MPIISVKDLIFDYPDKRAIKGISFELEPQSITAMVGPNGAGKTTILRNIAALDTPFSGSISIDGIDVLSNPRKAHEKIGFLQDFYGLYDLLTVADCLNYYASAHGVPCSLRKERILETARMLGLEDRLNQQAGNLSRGLRQRLAIAQAIIHRPAILLLDEPASGLDPEARIDLSRLLVSLRDSGMTILVSSHILVELEDYSTHMMIIDNGHLVDLREIRNSAATHRRWRMTMPMEAPEVVAKLIHLVDVTAISLEGRDATFDFHGDDNAVSRLIARITAAQIPFCGFAEDKPNIQSVYLEKMSAKAPPPPQVTPGKKEASPDATSPQKGA
ncbi:MAG TPA: ABC transporter ATP-binding protein [Rhodospirillaceae bacterium]|nr:MAG: hypothetical protein A2018_03350 [Alphaproteobacteria bacterium GWF2_58_20]HAU29317.1 ABC transporter ATP-binding protein [Rhodospirillaceae bacterium]